MTSKEQDVLLDILHAWNTAMAKLVEQEFERLNNQIYYLHRDLEDVKKRMDTALAYAEKQQPPQPAKKARV